MKKLCVLYIYHEQWRESERFQKISENKKNPAPRQFNRKKPRSFLGKTASKKQKYQVTKRKS